MVSMRKIKARTHRCTARRWRISWGINRLLRAKGMDPAKFWERLRWDTEHPVLVPTEEYHARET